MCKTDVLSKIPLLSLTLVSDCIRMLTPHSFICPIILEGYVLYDVCQTGVLE